MSFRAGDRCATVVSSGCSGDSSGNVFIADWGNNRIRKVSLDGIINTIAGDGVQDYSGDGGLATRAALSGPYALAVDGAGYVYVADTGNNGCSQPILSG